MRRSAGTIDKRNGRFRARIRVDGDFITIGTFASEKQAEAAIVLFTEKHRAAAPFAGMSVRAWGRKWLDARELDGVHRSVDGDRSVWRSRIDSASFADLPLAAVTPKDVRDWVAAQIRTPRPHTRKSGVGKPPARQTVANALNLLRVSLEDACQANLLEQNPARDVRVPRIARTSEPWTRLSAAEIARLTGERVGQPYRDIFTFAISTGLRAGEVFGLEWSDVDFDRGVARIRHSWRGAPTKRGEARIVHLFAPAIEALRRQQARTGKFAHVFPASDGSPHARGYDADLGRWLERAGIKRRVRFHDLRHTCASHLVSGTWGRAWSLEEVAGHLGHSTSATTRRYAHLCPEGLARAVKETHPELGRVLHLPAASKDASTSVQMKAGSGANFAESGATYPNRTDDLRFTKPLLYRLS